MQVLILAAGKGTRMGELTKDTPKPMLTIDHRTLLEWKMDNLPEEVTEVIIVVGYLKEKITSFFGNNYKGKHITYVEVELHGTGYAVWQCKSLITGNFLVLMGDDLYSKEAIRNAIKVPLSITVKYSEVPRGGCIKRDENGNFTGIEDKGKHLGFINTGLYSLTPAIFDFNLVQVPGTKEFGLPHTLVEISKFLPVQIIDTDSWFQVTTPNDVTTSEEILSRFR